MKMFVGLGLVALIISGCAKAVDSYLKSAPTSTNPVVGTPTGGNVNRESIPVVTFSITSSHRTTPEDVLHEIAIFAPGGGWGPSCSEKIYERPVIRDAPEAVGTSPEDTVKDAVAHLALGDRVRIVTCGWKPNELVKVTVISPNGEPASETKANGRSIEDGVVFDFATGPFDLLGLYNFVFEGKSGRLTYQVFYKMPAKPRFYHLEADTIVLYGFKPNEPIRLLAYGLEEGESSLYALSGWQEYTASPGGQLIIKVDRGYEYRAIGRLSDEIGQRIMLPTLVEAIKSSPNTDRLDIEALPLHGYSIVGKAVLGTRMKVVGQPRMYVSWPQSLTLWWRVCLDDGTVGWVEDAFVKRLSPSDAPANQAAAMSCPSATPLPKTNISGVWVGDFNKFAKRIESSEVAIFEDSNNSYSIVYLSPFDLFVISILVSPFPEWRTRAEEAFLVVLDISRSDACRLKVQVNTTYHANPGFEGTYPLSFCQHR